MDSNEGVISVTGEGDTPLEVFPLDMGAFSARVRSLPVRPATIVPRPGEGPPGELLFAIAFGCKALIADFDSGAPLKRYAEVLDFVLDNAQVYSCMKPPSRVGLVFNPENANRRLTAPDGWALFTFLHMRKADFERLREQVPFLIGMDSPFPPWNIGLEGS